MTYWVEAARRAASAFANREADALLTKALEASALIDAPSLAAHAQFDRGRARLALGHYESATADLATAQQLASALGDSSLEAAAVEQLGWAAYHARDGRVSPWRSGQSGIHRRVLVPGCCGAESGTCPGTWSRPSMRWSRRRLGGRVDPAVSATATSYLATALCHADRFGEAAPRGRRGHGALPAHGGAASHAQRPHVRRHGRANLGEFGAALELATRLRDEAHRFDAPFYRPRALNVLAWIWRELGEPELARDLATEAFETCSGGEGRDAEREPAANALLALAESAVLAGDPATAVDFLSQIDPLRRGVGYRGGSSYGSSSCWLVSTFPGRRSCATSPASAAPRNTRPSPSPISDGPPKPPPWPPRPAPTGCWPPSPRRTRQARQSCGSHSGSPLSSSRVPRTRSAHPPTPVAPTDVTHAGRPPRSLRPASPARAQRGRRAPRPPLPDGALIGPEHRRRCHRQPVVEIGLSAGPRYGHRDGLDLAVQSRPFEQPGHRCH